VWVELGAVVGGDIGGIAERFGVQLDGFLELKAA
jgi:hypothetical protein